MFVDTIHFEIRDFSTGQFEEFCVENRADFFEFIASHRFTRNIHFDHMFDFQFAREYKCPKFLRVAEVFTAAFEKSENLSELDDVDEMMGVFA